MKKNSSSIYQEWFSKAEEDFMFASIHLKDEKKYFAQICFFFQQAAEKYLKAYILKKKLKFRKVHDLIELLEICKPENADFETLREACEYLTDFYIDSRYPVHWKTRYILQDAQIAHEETQKIRKFILTQLKNNKK